MNQKKKVYPSDLQKEAIIALYILSWVEEKISDALCINILIVKEVIAELKAILARSPHEK